MSAASKHKLPIDLGNWPALKTAVPGLVEASKQVASSFADIQIFKPRAADYKGVKALLGRDLRLLTLQETLYLINYDQHFKEKLKGLPFWLEPIGTDLNGSHVLQSDGSIKGGRSSDPEKNVEVWKGPLPLLLIVHSDSDTTANHYRFTIAANSKAAGLCQAVVAVPMDMPIDKICGAARRQT